MHPPVLTKDPKAVKVEVQAAYRFMFPAGDAAFIARAFGWATDCFQGGFRNYQAVDAPYHDFEHTLQGWLCMARLLRGRHLAGAEPRLSQHVCEIGLLAMLLHDTGYLKNREDTQGTGAKYTITHVDRSARFAAELLAEKGFSPEDISAVQNMIRCTGVDTRLSVIPFQSDPERIAGFALGTADLLGQMAAEDYVEKLPMLYEEFAEAARYSTEKDIFVAKYTSAGDLMRRTPDFWQNFVRSKLDRDFQGLYRFLNDPYPGGPNGYFERIEANMERLRKTLNPSQAKPSSR